ncbi:MAG TPA: cupin domain-containing protein [Candidatus Limnocylindrales bacterium]|nr:cupin domain-containing protein [Candidatus Limnocylindrales bacterium]
MSYPEARYRGDGGEVSATYRPTDHEAEVVYANGTRCRYLAIGASTGGLYGLYRWEMAPAAGGPGPHFHRTLAESFYVLLGTVKIYDGNGWIDAAPGDFVHVPIGGIHGFRNDTDAAATMLIHFAPGAPREAYFEGLAEFARSGRPSDEEMADFYARHDNHWV